MNRRGARTASADAADRGAARRARRCSVRYRIPRGLASARAPTLARGRRRRRSTSQPGEALGIVGESGSRQVHAGARGAAARRPRVGGEVVWLGQPSSDLARRGAARRCARDLQIVFQDPLASLDPRMTRRGDRRRAAARTAAGPRCGRAHGARRRECSLRVGLGTNLLARYPHELSRRAVPARRPSRAR